MIDCAYIRGVPCFAIPGYIIIIQYCNDYNYVSSSYAAVIAVSMHNDVSMTIKAPIANCLSLSIISPQYQVFMYMTVTGNVNTANRFNGSCGLIV